VREADGILMKVVRDFKSEDEYLVTHIVEQTGIRLDSFLKERYRKRSREALKRAIDSGAITLQRRQSPHLMAGRLKASTQLIAGDEILVLSERKPEPPVNFDYRVLYEDDVLFVIEKPANLPVHPAGRYFFNTLLVHLRTQGHKNPLKAEREYFLVHRIDKETSGILVLAKERSVCAHLTRQFAERQTEKRYLAIARGITPEEFTVDKAMRRSTVSRVELKMMIATEEEG
jgi:RluA family pseudouridine synthase